MHSPRPGQDRIATPKPVRCPYCIEDREFKVMAARGGDGWHMCSACGHLSMVNNPAFRCPCARCAQSRTRIGRAPN